MKLTDKDEKIFSLIEKENCRSSQICEREDRYDFIRS